MNVLIAGGTGFVGKELTKVLLQQGYHVYILTRNPKAYQHDEITYVGYENSLEILPDFQSIINLAGDSLFGYWTKRKKEKIRESRLKTTQFLINFIKKSQTPPKVFINGSAIGFYGMSTQTIFTENSREHGDDFLAHVVVDWEQAAQQAEAFGIRTVYTRFGVVLGEEGGAFPMMAMPVKLFLGGRIGKGDQWISWVHIKDAVNIIHFCLLNEDIRGPVNVTAPNPSQNKDFMKTLAHVMKRPYWFPTPSWLMQVTVGEMSSLVTKGQYVLPKKLKDFQYEFLYPHLQQALEGITNASINQK